MNRKTFSVLRCLLVAALMLGTRCSCKDPLGPEADGGGGSETIVGFVKKADGTAAESTLVKLYAGPFTLSSIMTQGDTAAPAVLTDADGRYEFSGLDGSATYDISGIDSAGAFGFFSTGITPSAKARGERLATSAPAALTLYLSPLMGDSSTIHVPSAGMSTPFDSSAIALLNALNESLYTLQADFVFSVGTGSDTTVITRDYLKDIIILLTYDIQGYWIGTPAVLPHTDPSQVTPGYDTFIWEPYATAEAIAVDIAADRIYISDMNTPGIKVYSVSGDHLATWNNGTASPQGMRIDNGTLFMAVTYFQKVRTCDMAGNTLLEFGSQGPDDGTFLNTPVDIAVDRNGDIYVIEEPVYEGGWKPDVQKFDRNGNFLLKWGSAGTGQGQFHPDGRARAIAVDKTGDMVYVADYGNRNLEKFDLTGNHLGTIPCAIAPEELAIDSSGNVYTAMSTRVTVFNRQGEIIAVHPGPTSPTGIDIAADGNIYVAGWNYIHVIRADSSTAAVPETKPE